MTRSVFGLSKDAPDGEFLATLLRRLAEHYEPEDIQTWLYAGHPQLGGQTVMDAIEGQRLADVLALLDRLDDLTYL